MNTTRKGKIARLPKAVREELNQRLDDGEEGSKLVAWLDTLPPRWTSPIREQNLSEWRQGGYHDWQIQQEALDIARRVAAESGELQPAAGAPSLADQTARWLTARFLLAIRNQDGMPASGEANLAVLRGFCHDLVALRRGDHSALRLKIEETRLELEKSRTEAEDIAEFRRLAKNPKVRDSVFTRCRNDEDRLVRLRELFGPEESAVPV